MYGGTGTLVAALKSGATDVGGESINLKLNGTFAGSATTNSSGVATLTGVGLSGINAGTDSGGVSASFVGDSTDAAGGPITGDLAVAKADQTIAVMGPTDATYGHADYLISTSGGSGTGAVSFDAGTSNGCSIASGKLHVTLGDGSCSVTATIAADDIYNSATSDAFTVTIHKSA